jgi:hypothetical protein
VPRERPEWSFLMRKPPHSVRRFILPVGFAFTLVSVLLLCLAWLPQLQSVPGADDALAGTVSALGLGFSLIGLVLILIAVVLCKYRRLYGMALVCAVVVVGMWFIGALANA